MSEMAAECCLRHVQMNGLLAMDGDKTALPHAKQTDDALSQRFQKLQAKYSHHVPGQDMYNGMMINAEMSRAHFRQVDAMEIRETDCIVTGYPKSGTTWLQEILSSIYSDGQDSALCQRPTYTRVPYLEHASAFDVIVSAASPRLFKTHVPYRNLPKQTHAKRPKVIHIMRNPKDLAVSYFHFYRSLSQLGNFAGSWSEFLRMFMDGYVMMCSWFDYVRDWWPHRHEPNLCVVKYEDLKHDPYDTIARLAAFCDRPLSHEALEDIVKHTSFKAMKANPMTNFLHVSAIDSSISPFMRKGEVGDWKNYFTVAQVEAFDRLYEDKLGDLCGLKFDYTSHS